MLHDLQKASMWKRASAFIFDFILIAILSVGIILLLSSLLGYDGYTDKLEGIYDKYEQQYKVDFDLSPEEYEKLNDDEKAIIDDAYAALTSDEEMLNTYYMIISLTFLMITIGILVAFLVLEFTVPLLFKNGQTLGKKVFGVAVMRVDGVKINAPILFIRSVLGKYTLETMIPVMTVILIFFDAIDLAGIVIIGILTLVQLAMLIVTHTNSAIHDMLSSTVAVDMASQMIFDSRDEMLEYKKRVHAESVSRTE